MTQKTRQRLWLATLLLPPLLFFTTFVVYPIASALFYSLFDWQGVARAGFIGLENFRRLLSEPFRGLAWNALWHNGVVFLTILVVQNGLALLIAWVMSKEPRGVRFYQVVFFLPVMLALVLVGIQWRLFLAAPFGPLYNVFKDLFGWGPLLGQTETALFTLIMVNTWRWLGFPTLVFLAGIRNVPEEYLEAARLDGAGEWRVARHIIWPLLAPAVTIIVTLTYIGSFNWFDLPFVMQGLSGNPSGSTDVLGLLFYRTAFGGQSGSAGDFGLGSALAALMFLFVFVSSGLLTWWLRSREVEP